MASSNRNLNKRSTPLRPASKSGHPPRRSLHHGRRNRRLLHPCPPRPITRENPTLSPTPPTVPLRSLRQQQHGHRRSSSTFPSARPTPRCQQHQPRQSTTLPK